MPQIKTNGMDAAKRKFKEIKSFYIHDFGGDRSSTYPALLKGRGGAILILALLYRFQKSEVIYKALCRNLDRLLKDLETTEPLFSTFCSGLGGVGWLLIYLEEKKLIENEAIAELLTDIDKILLSELELMLKAELFDYLHGAIGIGLYFIKRKNIQALTKIIKTLENSAVEEDNEIKFKTYHYIRQKNVYDFGLAHGNANIAYFLTRCYKLKILPDICFRLLSGVLRFYFNNIKDISVAGSFFPSFKEVSSYSAQAATNYRSRLGWCYGDLTILNTILLTSLVLGDKKVEERTMELLLATTTRKSPEVTRVYDAGFCHGSSGLAIIYWNLYNRTGLDVFKASSNYWLIETLKMDGGHKDGLCGYLFPIEGIGNIPLDDILDGLGGVALSFSSILNNVDSDWTECVLLS